MESATQIQNLEKSVAFHLALIPLEKYESIYSLSSYE